MKLKELYYAGSHGMDIVGPAVCGSFYCVGSMWEIVTCTMRHVPCCVLCIIMFIVTITTITITTTTTTIIQDQTRPANLAFQPAAKFEPVMNEVYSKLQEGCVSVCVCTMCERKVYDNSTVNNITTDNNSTITTVIIQH